MNTFSSFCYSSSFFSAALFANTESSLRLDSLVLEGKERIYELQFREAEETFLRIQQEYPDHPHGYTLQSYVTSLIFSMDQTNDSLALELESQFDKSLDMANDYKNRYKDDPESYFYLAIANGVKALYHVVNRSYVKGFFSGRKTKGNLEKAVKMDSTYYDAYFALGLFHYYADLLPGGRQIFCRHYGISGRS